MPGIGVMAKVTGVTGKTNYRILQILSSKKFRYSHRQVIIDMFFDLGDYLKMMDKAARLNNAAYSFYDGINFQVGLISCKEKGHG